MSRLWDLLVTAAITAVIKDSDNNGNNTLPNTKGMLADNKWFQGSPCVQGLCLQNKSMHYYSATFTCNAQLLCMWSCKPALIIFQRGAPKRRASSQRHEGDSELPSEILFARHSQMSSSLIFFARSMSTCWCGVHTLFRESCLDVKTHGGHWCGVQSKLSFRVIALASFTRR